MSDSDNTPWVNSFGDMAMNVSQPYITPACYTLTDNMKPQAISFGVNKTYLTITADGKLVPGEGLSTDEATQSFFEIMQHVFTDKMREAVNKEMADEIKTLNDRLFRVGTILRHLTPEKYPDVLFIHGLLGEKDQNGMPEKLLVVPAYGCDFSYVYERTDKTTGPEW